MHTQGDCKPGGMGWRSGDGRALSFDERRGQFPQGKQGERVPGRALGPRQGCIRREGTSEAAPEAVRKAVEGGCQSGWGRLPSVTHAVDLGTWRQGDSG